MKKHDKLIAIDMGRCTSNGSEHSFGIRFIDEASGVTIVDVRLSLEDMMLAITGHYLSHKPATLGNLDIIGRKHVHTSILIDRKQNEWHTEKGRKAIIAIIDRAVAKLATEKPGHDWQPHYEDAGNNHLRQPDGSYRVAVHGWEPREP